MTFLRPCEDSPRIRPQTRNAVSLMVLSPEPALSFLPGKFPVNFDFSQLAGLRPEERLGCRNGRRFLLFGAPVSLSMLRRISRFWCFGTLVALLVLALVSPLRAQDHTVPFSTSEQGVSKAVTNWGMGIVGGADVIKSGLIHMGADQIDVIIIPFTLMDPLANGDI